MVLIIGGYMTQEELDEELLRAVIINDINKAHDLIIQGGNVNYKNIIDFTPLFCSRTLEMFRLLLENGADIRYRNGSGETLLHHAFSLEMLNILIENGLNPNQVDVNGSTPLHTARSAEIVTALIQAGANPNQVDKNGLTPLHTARSEEVIIALIQAGANPNQGDIFGSTLLHTAQSTKVITALIQAGANPNQGNIFGLTPLHTARSAEVITALIQAGANPNQGDKNGLTLLHTAQSAELITALIQAGANPNQGDIIGLTPLHTAPSVMIANVLLENGANPNKRADDGRTPLFFARDSLIVQALIDKGANVNQRDNYGNTALHQVRSLNIAKTLIENGINCNIPNNEGYTPLDMIQDEQIRQYLIEHGAKPGTPDQVKRQIENVNVDQLPIPTGPEYGHSAAPVADDEIRAFVNNDINIQPDTDASRTTMFNALKEVCRTPTGCIFFRATRANVNQMRRQNPHYRLDVTLSADTNVDYFGCVKHNDKNRVYIQVNKIQNSYSTEGEVNFEIGSTFLHEAMHVRQFQNIRIRENNKTIIDAPTSAFTRQMALESPYPEIRRRESISETERRAYERVVGLKSNGSYNAEYAQRFSAHLHGIYTEEFLTRLASTPIVNYGTIKRQMCYLLDDIHNRLLCHVSNAPTDTSNADLERRFGLHFSNTDIVQNQVLNALTPLAARVYNNLNPDQRRNLLNVATTTRYGYNPQYLSENLFPVGSANREIAEAYLKTAKDINDSLINLANYSNQIHDNPNNVQILRESAKIRRYLNEEYGIFISITNVLGERVADVTNMTNEHSSSTIEGILRQNEQNSTLIDIDAGQNHTGTYNPTLAQNSESNITTDNVDYQTTNPLFRNNHIA